MNISTGFYIDCNSKTKKGEFSFSKTNSKLEMAGRSRSVGDLDRIGMDRTPGRDQSIRSIVHLYSK